MPEQESKIEHEVEQAVQSSHEPTPRRRLPMRQRPTAAPSAAESRLSRSDRSRAEYDQLKAERDQLHGPAGAAAGGV